MATNSSSGSDAEYFELGGDEDGEGESGLSRGRLVEPSVVAEREFLSTWGAALRGAGRCGRARGIWLGWVGAAFWRCRCGSGFMMIMLFMNHV